ncbi:uncharacterized protein LOC134805776 [Cydia splendana]|uniref:uncharacterized protein LOC134805776 n=1 Tax=Cydia splendana TaxID=1100963 RepID=UPI00300D913C
MECSKCSLVIKTEELLKCSACQYCYHYYCVGISDVDFKKILPMNKPKWKCGSCKQPAKKPASPVVINKPLADTNPELNLPSTSIVNIDTDALMKYFDGKFAILNANLTALRADFDSKLSELTLTVNSWDGRIKTLESNVDSFSNEIHGLRAENEQLHSEVSTLQKHCDDAEQKSRLCNIELQNVPEKKSENLIHIAVALGKVLGTTLTHNHIKDVHRVPHNKEMDRPKNIIIQLTTRRLRDDLVAAARVRRGLTAGQLFEAAGCSSDASSAAETVAATSPIYINEHLTLKNKILYAKAREIRKNKNYRWIWVKNATILMRKTDDSRILAIKTESDLDRL